MAQYQLCELEKLREFTKADGNSWVGFKYYPETWTTWLLEKKTCVEEFAVKAHYCSHFFLWLPDEVPIHDHPEEHKLLEMWEHHHDGHENPTITVDHTTTNSVSVGGTTVSGPGHTTQVTLGGQ